MTDGYIYCFSNISMPNILKIGTTERTPKERLKEANSPDTWKPPTPYKIEFAKKVKNPKEKETTLHKLLEQYTERINTRREFSQAKLVIQGQSQAHLCQPLRMSRDSILIMNNFQLITLFG